MKKFKIIVLMGKAGSGKDTILHELVARRPDLNEMVSCTTRPRREGEIDGVNYFFLTTEQFTNKVLNNEMLEATEFNNWFYGTSYDALRSDCISVGVFNPAGVEALLHHHDIEVKVFYITASKKTRLLRQLFREGEPDVDEIIRRYRADEIDFDDLDFEYIEVNNDGNLNQAVSFIEANID